MSLEDKKTERSRFQRFEDFLSNGGSQKEFWQQREVRKRLNGLRREILVLEDEACNNRGDVDKVPEDVYVIADGLGVSPEMILDHVGKDVLFRRKMDQEQTQLTPNGLIISRKVIFIWRFLMHLNDFLMFF